MKTYTHNVIISINEFHALRKALHTSVPDVGLVLDFMMLTGLSLDSFTKSPLTNLDQSDILNITKESWLYCQLKESKEKLQQMIRGEIKSSHFLSHSTRSVNLSLRGVSKEVLGLQLNTGNFLHVAFHFLVLENHFLKSQLESKPRLRAFPNPTGAINEILLICPTQSPNPPRKKIVGRLEASIDKWNIQELSPKYKHTESFMNILFEETKSFKKTLNVKSLFAHMGTPKSYEVYNLETHLLIPLQRNFELLYPNGIFKYTKRYGKRSEVVEIEFVVKQVKEPNDVPSSMWKFNTYKANPANDIARMYSDKFSLANCNVDEATRYAIEETNGRCAGCAKDLYKVNGNVIDFVGLLTNDHIIPASRFGIATRGNIAIMCSDCNGQKASNTFERFWESRSKAKQPLLFSKKEMQEYVKRNAEIYKADFPGIYEFSRWETVHTDEVVEQGLIDNFFGKIKYGAVKKLSISFDNWRLIKENVNYPNFKSLYNEQNEIYKVLGKSLNGWSTLKFQYSAFFLMLEEMYGNVLIQDLKHWQLVSLAINFTAKAYDEAPEAQAKELGVRKALIRVVLLKMNFTTTEIANILKNLPN